MDWKPGDRLVHRYNRDLGPGLVVSVTGRRVEVEFPTSGDRLWLALGSDALAPLVLHRGARVRLLETAELVTIEDFPEPGQVLLSDGRVVGEPDLWPENAEESPADRLARGDVDPLGAFSLRLDSLRLAALREADGLGSFLGGRIQLFPHQLHAAELATKSDPARWLLADEVGLGKTVEACLILNHLIQTGRAERTLVVAPRTLTVQWLGELWRKYHQVFVLLDDKRLADVERDYGAGFNPFDAHRQVVLDIETLRESPRLVEQAVEAGVDLLIVDEAHHLRRAPGHPGNPEYRAIRPITELDRHVLLLTATPLEDDAHGFFRLLQLLRPEEFAEEEDFRERLERRAPLPPCTSSTRRDDIGGMPPRVPAPVDLDAESWTAQAELETALRGEPTPHAIARRRKARRIRRALASGAALEAVLEPADKSTRRLAREAQERDPRVEWLVENAPRWRRARDKTLVFVAHRETLEVVKAALGRRVQIRVGVFHEDLSPGQRDIEVAQFRLASGPSILLSTECGGEGRNFQFCTRLVLFDLPWNPMTVEQRIGRLDRIGRSIPVEIVYFRPPSGVGALVSSVYESLGLFRRPLGSLERELATVESTLEEVVTSDEEEGAFRAAFDRIVEEAREAYDRIREAAYHELHRDPYDSSMADGILARIPPDLEELTEEVVVSAGERLGLHIEEHSHGGRYSIELGSRSRVESLPGVPVGASFLGTFDRAEAVEHEDIDFFASGHPLVEGVLAHLDESSIGRIALLHVQGEETAEGFGLVGLFKSGPVFEGVAIDIAGQPRPDWMELILRRPLRSRRVKAEAWAAQPGWGPLVRSLYVRLAERGRPVAVAALRVGVRSETE